MSHRAPAVVEKDSEHFSGVKGRLVCDENVSVRSPEVKSHSRLLQGIDVSHIVKLDIALRFSNAFFALLWRISRVDAIQYLFKQPFGYDLEDATPVITVVVERYVIQDVLFYIERKVCVELI